LRTTIVLLPGQARQSTRGWPGSSVDQRVVSPTLEKGPTGGTRFDEAKGKRDGLVGRTSLAKCCSLGRTSGWRWGLADHCPGAEIGSIIGDWFLSPPQRMLSGAKPLRLAREGGKVVESGKETKHIILPSRASSSCCEREFISKDGGIDRPSKEAGRERKEGGKTLKKVFDSSEGSSSKLQFKNRTPFSLWGSRPFRRVGEVSGREVRVLEMTLGTGTELKDYEIKLSTRRRKRCTCQLVRN